MRETVKGAKALVTGGAVRIGKALCEMLADGGADVCIHYNRSAAAAESLRDALAEKGVSAWTVQGNLMTESACRDVIEKASAMAGGLDILVNNASVFRKETLDEADMDVLSGQMWPNFFAPLQLMRAFAEQTDRGRIVNLLDRRITGLDTTCAPYFFSKKALAEATRLAALHYAPRIRVNGVAPGAVLPPPGEGAAYIKDHAGVVPLAVQVTPEDVAEAVRFVLESGVVTGQIIHVDGGQHMNPDGTGK